MDNTTQTNSDFLVEKILEELSSFFEDRNARKTEFDHFFVIVEQDPDDGEIVWDFEIKNPNNWDVDLERVVGGVFNGLGISDHCGCGTCGEHDDTESTHCDCDGGCCSDQKQGCNC